MRALILALACTALLLAGCSYDDLIRYPLTADRPSWTPAPLTDEQLAVAEDLNLDPEVIADLHRRPIHTYRPRDVDQYLRFVRATMPDLRERIVHLGRKNIGQRYAIYLLGEHPYEVYDQQPLYTLDRSDCVVFSEHAYAMALGHDWESFFNTLQDIRYRDGEIGILTRNHWTLAVWNTENDWLVEDVTEQLGGGGNERALHQTLRRNRWFMRKFGLDPGIPDEELTHTYIPFENLGDVLPDLRDGDWVNVIRGTEEGGWAGHTGLIAIGDDGTVNFLHSSRPWVREEPIMEYVRRAEERNAKYAADPPRTWKYHPTIGFKFLRLREEALEEQFAVEMADLVHPVPVPDAE